MAITKELTEFLRSNLAQARVPKNYAKLKRRLLRHPPVIRDYELRQSPENSKPIERK